MITTLNILPHSSYVFHIISAINCCYFPTLPTSRLAGAYS